MEVVAARRVATWCVLVLCAGLLVTLMATRTVLVIDQLGTTMTKYRRTLPGHHTPITISFTVVKSIATREDYEPRPVREYCDCERRARGNVTGCDILWDIPLVFDNFSYRYNVSTKQALCVCRRVWHRNQLWLMLSCG